MGKGRHSRRGKHLPDFPYVLYDVEAEITSQTMRLLEILRLSRSLLLSSTQIPQMLLDEPWCMAKSVRTNTKFGNQYVKVGGCIAITEPRRVAAVSLARRVAEEMGTQLGSNSPASTVGYAVRFDNSTSPSTRIKFLTEGMLLQEILQDPWLRKYSAIIVDEVHERGVNVDVVLGFLRNMIAGKCEGRGGMGMKVIVMSATAEVEKLKAFFEVRACTDSLDRTCNDACTFGNVDSKVLLALCKIRSMISLYLSSLPNTR